MEAGNNGEIVYEPKQPSLNTSIKNTDKTRSFKRRDFENKIKSDNSIIGSEDNNTPASTYTRSKLEEAA
jgi:hypothetical protein